MKPQGLKIARATNPLDPAYGHVMFMRSSKGKKCSADEACVECYRRQTQLLSVTGVRETMFSELKDGAPLEPHVAALSWCDGDAAQIKAIAKHGA